MSNTEISRAQRLDQQVVEQIPALSRSFATRLIEDGKVTVNGIQQLKSGYKLRPADIVVVDYDVSALGQVPDIELPVLYEDEQVVVINKPVGILSHSKGAFNPEATVATWLRGKVAGLDGERAGIVHRLDRATSGVMICAKTPTALTQLQRQFAQRKAKKTYISIVSGLLDPQQAVIDMPIERNPKRPQTFRVGAGGKSAITAYTVQSSSAEYSLLELKPTTGRTHQLRVHLKHIGHPIVGDPIYSGEPYERLMLHALSLEITLPGGIRKTFTAPLPKEFTDLVTVKADG